MTTTMQAAVFVAKDRIELREVKRPEPGPGEALIKELTAEGDIHTAQVVRL